MTDEIFHEIAERRVKDYHATRTHEEQWQDLIDWALIDESGRVLSGPERRAKLRAMKEDPNVADSVKAQIPWV